MRAKRLTLLAALISSSYCVNALASYSNTSRYGIHVGFDESDNVYVFCTPYNITRPSGASSDQVTTRFRRIFSDGSTNEAIVTALATTQARLQCFKNSSLTGAPIIEVGGTNESTDQSTAVCPTSAPYGAYAECRVLSNLDVLQQPYVYRATACGNGIASVSSQLLGQETGKQDVTATVTDQNGTPASFFYNDTVTPASIYGTDEGVPFFSGGHMYFAFGDTNTSNRQLAHNTLATSSTVAPFYGGYWLGWYGTSSTDTVADQVINPVLPDETQCGNTGVIPSGGFSITEGGHDYRFIWYMSVKTWNYNPTTGNFCDTSIQNGRLRVNRGSFAYSIDGGAFGRMDAGFPNSGLWWSGTGNFTNTFAYDQIVGTGAGYIYLYGFKADNNMPDSNSGVYLARVHATWASIQNGSQYQYWNGSTWISGNESVATPLSGIAAHARELSVAFNSYASKYIMLVTDTTNGMRLYQSDELQGPWSVVTTLPYHLGNYAALTHDRFSSDQGKEFGYFMSDWGAYNVGAWWATVTRNALSNCTPGDP